MKLRELIPLVEPQHQFTLTRQDTDAFQEEDLHQILVLKCSCKWKTRRAVNLAEIDGGYSTVLTQEWMHRESLNHLLDQEIPE